MNSTYQKVVVIGGGTGSFAVLSGLKNYNIDITVLVNMADDGGSTGILRDEMGVLPSGDVRQCLVALSDASEELRELFNFRYSEGTFKGHSFGNLFLSTLEKMTGDFAGAVKTAEDVLSIRGRVVPITLDNIRLAMDLPDGSTIHGESKIDVADFIGQGGRPFLRLEPQARLNPEANQAIAGADLIVIAPGDLYTSLGPLLLVSGVSEALRNTEARVMYVANLVVKPGHTTGFTVSKHAAEIERFAGSNCVDVVLYNIGQPGKQELARYIAQGEALVEIDSAMLDLAHYRAVGADLLSRHKLTPKAGDSIHRSYIRHDSAALAGAILSL
jgi:uncharacterized cofD-like protein